MQPEAQQDGVNIAFGHPKQRVLEVLSSLSYRTGELSSYLLEIVQGVSELKNFSYRFNAR
ncbi:hypothetical protein H6G17_24770 [Chroococcidiopsis sp. FACHB-1243]|uniref:hypothetical protein n=1 Tax=Chroococcidiopsis sp. [FACHB-1243] TaxID=2692781 RepID=UPI00178497CB|nr:hypothetical protein [Chroococcidiopsis sp. [FACHB-1243]]MBD2308688.1 hypothetical protein [Chroococcidiopsis sp. [FACHB-1243]]